MIKNTKRMMFDILESTDGVDNLCKNGANYLTKSVDVSCENYPVNRLTDSILDISI